MLLGETYSVANLIAFISPMLATLQAVVAAETELLAARAKRMAIVATVTQVRTAMHAWVVAAYGPRASRLREVRIPGGQARDPNRREQGGGGQAGSGDPEEEGQRAQGSRGRGRTGRDHPSRKACRLRAPPPERRGRGRRTRF